MVKTEKVSQALSSQNKKQKKTTYLKGLDSGSREYPKSGMLFLVAEGARVSAFSSALETQLTSENDFLQQVFFVKNKI